MKCSKATTDALIDLNREVVMLQREKQKLILEIKKMQANHQNYLMKEPQTSLFELLAPIADLYNKWSDGIHELKHEKEENGKLNSALYELRQEATLLYQQIRFSRSSHATPRASPKATPSASPVSSIADFSALGIQPLSSPTEKPVDRILLFHYQFLMEEFFQPEKLPPLLIPENEFHIFEINSFEKNSTEIPEDIQDIARNLHSYTYFFDDLTQNEKHEVIDLVIKAKKKCSTIIENIKEINFLESLGEKEAAQARKIRRNLLQNYEILSCALLRFQFKSAHIK